jgi:hypothetical protein
MKKLLWLPLAMTLSLPVAAAELCEDIDTISDGWHEVAKFIDEKQDDGLSDEEETSLVELSEALGEGTGALAAALLEHGNDDEKKFGRKLDGYMDEIVRLSGDEEAAYLVDIIDEMVSTLDEVVAYCDKVN